MLSFIYVTLDGGSKQHGHQVPLIHSTSRSTKSHNRIFPLRRTVTESVSQASMRYGSSSISWSLGREFIPFADRSIDLRIRDFFPYSREAKARLCPLHLVILSGLPDHGPWRVRCLSAGQTAEKDLQGLIRPPALASTVGNSGHLISHRRTLCRFELSLQMTTPWCVKAW